MTVQQPIDIHSPQPLWETVKDLIVAEAMKSIKGSERRRALAKKVRPLLEAIHKKTQDCITAAERTEILKNNNNDDDYYLQLKEILVTLGIAELITLGDWEVDRISYTESMGIKSLADFENSSLKFQRANHPGKTPVIRSMNAGPGSAVTLANNDNPEVHRIGYGDKIYFSLHRILGNFLKPEHQNDSSLKNFINIISTVILRAHRQDKKTGKKNGLLLGVATNIRQLTQILQKIPQSEIRKHLENIRDSRSILRDLEFTEEKIEEHIDIEKLAEYLEDPQHFLATYFNHQFYDGIVDSSKDYRPETFMKYVDFHPEDIFLGKFEEIAERIPRDFHYHLAHDFRSASHLDDAAYQKFMADMFSQLEPGGVIFGDGIRESYTRKERFSELQALQNPDCRVSVIVSPEKKVVGHFIQKRDPKGIFPFFTDFIEAYPEESPFSSEYQLVPIDTFIEESPVHVFRSEFIGKLKAVLGEFLDPHESVRPYFKGYNELFIPHLILEILDTIKNKIANLPDRDVIKSILAPNATPYPMDAMIEQLDEFSEVHDRIQSMLQDNQEVSSILDEIARLTTGHMQAVYDQAA